jgi:hypothetical protein
MEITKIETLDSYFKTENEHWNEFAFKTLQKALESEMFSDFIPLMDLYESSIAIASKTHREKPFEGLQLIIAECDKNEFNIQQKIFLLERVFEYLDQTEFENLESTKSEYWYSSEIQNLIKSQNEVYNKELKTTLPEYNKSLVSNIRDALKDMMQKEIVSLPDTLKALEPVQRLNILCKLIPYVLPKVESVIHTQGEPKQQKNEWFN